MDAVSKPDWLDRFAARVIALRPRTSALAAARHAESTYLDASDMLPEEAAEMYLDECPPD